MKKKVWIPDNRKQKVPLNLSIYTHIRGYHACRPEDVKSYVQEGIRLLDHKAMQKTAARVFNLSVTEIKKMEKERDLSPSDKIYFCAFKRELIKGSGHYLCWGSEYLAGLACLLDMSERGRYHTILENTGTPTLFICDVPIEAIPDWLLNDIQEHYDPDDSNCSFWINDDLPPDCIIAHEHPQQIFNPVQWRTFTNNRLFCSYCEDGQRANTNQVDLGESL